MAIGGDLSPKRLIKAYQSGIFPWFNDDGPILWWSPDPRAVLFPDDLRINRSLKRALKNHNFKFSHNRCFLKVMQNCAKPRASNPGTWITRDMLNAYLDLHELGLAHSFECWQDNELVGGMYGVWLGGLFCAESMFHKVNNASKILLVHAVEYLRQHQVELIDIQIMSEHLQSLGAVDIARDEYLDMLCDLN